MSDKYPRAQEMQFFAEQQAAIKKRQKMQQASARKVRQKRVILRILVALALIGFVIAGTCLSMKIDNAKEQTLRENGYDVVGSWGQGMSLWYVIRVGECRFQLTYDSPNTVVVFKGVKSPQEGQGIVGYLGSTDRIGPAIVGYTPASFKKTREYRSCL